MAETRNVCPSLHMPLQSGSDDVLRRMRRSYRAERYLGIIERVRAAMPARRDHHRHHRRLPRRDGGLTSRRPWTSCAPRASPGRSPSSTPSGRARPPPTWPTKSMPKVVADRYGRLVELQDELSWEANRALVGHGSRCCSPKGRGARTPAPAGFRAAPATGGWCISMLPARPKSRGPGTSPRPSSPAAHRITCSPTARCSACDAPPRATLGRPVSGRSHAARPARGAETVGLGLPRVGAPA